jgi:hypothetical protein
MRDSTSLRGKVAPAQGSQNMKALIPLLIVSTSALAVTTVQFAHRASTEGKRADDALVLSEKHEARIHELEKAQGTLAQQLVDAQQAAPIIDTATTSGRRAAPNAAQAPLRVAPPQVATLSRAPDSAKEVQWMARPFSPTQQSPAAQRYMRAQMKAVMRRQYGDVGPALGLSQEQATKLIDVLADPQARMPAVDLRKMPVDRASMLQVAADAQKRTDAAVAAVIGENKLPQWQEYQKTMPERSQVNMVRDQMQQMGTPLTDDQRAQLVDILVEQHQLNPRPEMQQLSSLPPDETYQASMKWQDESDKTFLERAKSVLTKEQYEQYRDFQEWQSEMRNNAFRNFRPGMPVNQSVPVGEAGAVGLATSSVFMSAAPVEVSPPPQKRDR